MFSRSLANIQRFFVATRNLTKEGYFIPKPPKRCLTESQILHSILKEKKINYAGKLDQPEFAQAEKQEAKKAHEELMKKTEEERKEYEKTYGYPKKGLSAFNYYVTKVMETRNGQNVIDLIKEAGKTYKSLPESELTKFKDQQVADKERFNQQKKQYEEKHKELKVPSMKMVNQYNIFVEEHSKGRKIEMTQIAELWKQQTEEKKSEYAAKAEKINAANLVKLEAFSQKLQLNEDDKSALKKGFQSHKAIKEDKEKKAAKKEKLRQEKKEARENKKTKSTVKKVRKTKQQKEIEKETKKEIIIE